MMKDHPQVVCSLFSWIEVTYFGNQREPVHAFKLQYYILYLGQGIQRV